MRPMSIRYRIAKKSALFVILGSLLMATYAAGASAYTKVENPAPTTAITVGAVSVDPTPAVPGKIATFTARITVAKPLSSAIVDFQMYSQSGHLVDQVWQYPVSFKATAARLVTVRWAVPKRPAVGVYILKVGIFGRGWKPLYAWRDPVGRVAVGIASSLTGSDTTETVTAPTTGLQVSVTSNGSYAIHAREPRWTFGGSVGHPLTHIASTVGRDAVGAYKEVSFTTQDAPPREGRIRLYANKPIILFADTYPRATTNDAPFPRLDTYPRNLYHMSYDGGFGLHTFTTLSSGSPWTFFDGNDNTFILSPASDFMTASITRATDGAIASGVDAGIALLPQGFTHRTMLVVGHGINTMYDTWGRAMTDLQGKIRPANDADVGLKYLGYWTDRGANYYYKYDPSRGYAGTLLGVRDDFRREGIPLGYMQLDSWWYPKGASHTWQGDPTNNGGGIYTYDAAPDLFPQGLQAFQQQLGVPLITHARWIDPSSPYHQQYAMSRDAIIDPRYWRDRAAYLKAAGVVSYEQDWLDSKALPALNLHDRDAFMDNMAAAMGAAGLTMQYCLPLPRDYLQSTRYNNLLTMRVSWDRFGRDKWDQFLYGSRLTGAVGVWPWSDVFMSSETDNLLLSDLSGGMVGVGDPIGALDKANLLKVIRADGVIVKPDAPIVPVDDMYAADAQGADRPMVAYAYTDHGALKNLYVFAYRRGAGAPITFTPAALGLAGKVYVYNYFTGTGTIVNDGAAFSDSVADSAYYLVVPLGPSGIGFLGDLDQFVSLGKQRVSRLVDNGQLQATITFATGESSRTMQGYAPAPPRVTALVGTVGAITYDTTAHIFRVVVSPGANHSAAIELAGNGP